MTKYRTPQLVVAGLLLLSVAVPAFVGTAAANHKGGGGNPIDEILDNNHEESNDSDGIIGRMKGYVPHYLVESMAALDGQLQRLYSGLGDVNPFGDPPATNEEYANSFANKVHAYNETFMTLVNNETTPSTAYDAHKVTFAHDASDPHTMFVVVSIKNDAVTDIRPLNSTEFNQTGRTVDVEWVVDGMAAKDMDTLTADLAHHIEGGKAIGRTKQAQLVGKYCDVSAVTSSNAPGKHCDIRSDLWMTHENLYDGVNESAS